MVLTSERAEMMHYVVELRDSATAMNLQDLLSDHSNQVGDT